MWQHMFSMPVMRTVWRRELSFLNILIIFNISNIDKEVNKELPEDDLIEDQLYEKVHELVWIKLKDNYSIVLIQHNGMDPIKRGTKHYSTPGMNYSFAVTLC